MNKKLGTAILLTGITTFTIHMINKVQFSFSTVKNILSCPNNKYYEWRFGKIRYITVSYTHLTLPTICSV